MSTSHIAPHEEPAALRAWRANTFHLLVRVLLVMTLPVLVSEAVGAVQHRRYEVLTAGLLFYSALVVCAIVRHIPQGARVACLLLVTGGLGLFLLLRMGLVGAGRVYLYSFTLYAVLLLSWRSAFFAWGAVLSLAGLILSATGSGAVPLAPDIAQRITEPATLMTNWLVLFASSGMAIFAIRSLIGEFAASLRAAESARTALAETNADLERQVAERTAALERQLSYAQATAQCAQLLLSSGVGERRDWSSVARAIEHLRAAVGASRMFVYQYSYDVVPTRFQLIAETVAPDGVPFIIPDGDWSVVPAELLASLRERRSFGGPVESAFAAHPASRRLLESNGVRAVLLVPIYVGEQLWGHMGIADRTRDRVWDEVTTRLLFTAADMVAAFAAGREAAETLTRAKEAAEAASKAKSTFLAHMSHEIRTPLNAVIGVSDLLTEAAPSGEQRHYAETIRAAGASLLAVINNILDLSKIESGRLELDEQPFDLYACLQSAADVVAYDAARKGLTFDLKIDPSLPATLLGDSGRLRQVLINLLANAVKFTEQGGVRLEAMREQTTGAQQTARITIHDTGPGITAAERERIFEAFVQTGSARGRGGTGLGLTISRQIVQAMGGTIAIASPAGPGASFVVTLPLRVAPAAAHPGPAALGQAPLGPLRVLVAEDNPVNQEVARLLLSRLGAVARVVTDGRAAVAAARREHFDIVLMDIQMPELDGTEATRQIRASSTPGIQPRIVALTALALEGDRQRYLDGGFDDYLSKPLQIASLRAVLAQASPTAVPPVEPAEIDWRQIAQIIGSGSSGQAARRSRLIHRLFHNEVSLQIARLGAAIERDDRQEVRLIAHRLLGSARQLGATTMAAICTELEATTEGNSRASLEASFARLRVACARTQDLFVERYPDSLSQAEPTPSA